MSDSGGPGKPLKAARPRSWRSPALVSVGKDLVAAVLAERATSPALGATWAVTGQVGWGNQGRPSASCTRAW